MIAKRTGLRLKLVRTQTWSETLRKVTQGEIQFIGGIAQTGERERVNGLRFTSAFCTFPTAVVTRKDTDLMTTLDDIKMHRIAVPRDYASTEELQRTHPHAHFVITATEEESMLMVSGNRADATIMNIASASYIAHKDGLDDLKISGFTDVNFLLRFGVRNDEPELYSILEKGLATLDEHQDEMIYAKYLTPGSRGEVYRRRWRNRAMYSILIASAALIVVLFWNRSLASEIRRRKRTESALHKAHDELEVRAKELDGHVAKMRVLNEKLTATNEELSSFSYSVSHDLKSPLRRVRNFVDLLGEDGAAFNPETREYLGAIQHEARHMQELIEALLIYGRIGRMEMHITSANVDELVREVVRDAQSETKDREILWEIHPLPEMHCDKGLIRRAFVNLIDNAVKFTRGRSPANVEIGTFPGKPGDNEVVFYVRDNGAGFDMAYSAKLFETFQRLHSQDQFEGSGIGLANVRRIVHRHGGRVWAEGEVDKGATFYFSLPATASSGLSPDATAPEASWSHHE